MLSSTGQEWWRHPSLSFAPTTTASVAHDLPVCEAVDVPPLYFTPQTSSSAHVHTAQTKNPLNHLQKMFPQMELVPRNSPNGGALGESLSTTELYEARNCSYFSALPETTMQLRHTLSLIHI